MDTTADDWDHLVTQAKDRDAWRRKVTQVAASSTSNWQQLARSMVVQRRKRLASKTRFHIYRSALSKKILTVKKKAQRLTNEKARDAYYRKSKTKYEEHTKKENYFEPRKRHATHAKQTTPQVLHYIPNWENAKGQVFSSSSSSQGCMLALYRPTHSSLCFAILGSRIIPEKFAKLCTLPTYFPC